jgi:hypothetical protein
MNPATENALKEFLDKLNNGIDQTVTFGSEQIPDVIQQLLMWSVVEGIVSGLFGLFLLVLTFWAAWRFGWKKTPAPDSTKDHPRFVETLIRNIRGDLHEVCLVLSVVQFGATIVSLAYILDFMIPLQIWLAPKLFLLEYAAELAK